MHGRIASDRLKLYWFTSKSNKARGTGVNEKIISQCKVNYHDIWSDSNFSHHGSPKTKLKEGKTNKNETVANKANK